MELGRTLHGLGEHVRDVVRGANEGDLEFEGLHYVADEEVAPLDVLHAVVVLRVVGDVARRLRVGREARRGQRRRLKLRLKLVVHSSCTTVSRVPQSFPGCSNYVCGCWVALRAYPRGGIGF